MRVIVRLSSVSRVPTSRLLFISSRAFMRALLRLPLVYLKAGGAKARTRPISSTLFAILLVYGLAYIALWRLHLLWIVLGS